MSKYTAFLLLAVFVALAASQGRRIHANVRDRIPWWTDGKANILSSRSFENLIGKDKHSIVQFCATFAAECEQLAPEYNKLAEMYAGTEDKHTEVFVAKIDGWTFNSLSQAYDVTSFPDIRFIPKGNATFSVQYEGELTADKLSAWLEAEIKKYAATHETNTEEAKKHEEEKKPEETKHAETHKEPANEEPKEPSREIPKEAAREVPKQPSVNSPNQAKPAAAAAAAAAPAPDSEDAKKEFKLVLNTSLLQGQFEDVQTRLNKLNDEVQGRFNKLNEELQGRFNKLLEDFNHNIGENFKKVEALNQVLEGNKREYQAVVDTVRGHGDKVQQILNNLHGNKEDIKSSITRHAEDHLNTIKDSVGHIKSKVFEAKVEEPKGPGLLHNIVYMVIGGAIGGVVTYLIAGAGNKKKRSMLD